MFVLVVDQNRKPLNPCHPARARKFLKSGRAVVLRRYPFTIMLNTSASLGVDPERSRRVKDVEKKPNSVCQEYRLKLDPGSRTTGISILKDDKIIWAAELNHRGYSIKQSLESRRALRRFCPIGSISMELVRFDTQLMQNPEISGTEYQQGELAGYETREYLLEKWGRRCAYCGKEGVPLEVEHIHPKSKGGSNRVSNQSCLKLTG
jgi:hypothetical protein